jgi:peptidoglycan/xylan/chitin deacetylase (PgdA/CDA1 family)
VSLPSLDDAGLAAEVETSRAVLGEVIGAKVGGFSYPYGHLDTRVVEAVQGTGYDYACAIWRSHLSGRHALLRTYLHDRDHMLRLDAKRLRHKLISNVSSPSAISSVDSHRTCN